MCLLHNQEVNSNNLQNVNKKNIFSDQALREHALVVESLQELCLREFARVVVSQFLVRLGTVRTS